MTSPSPAFLDALSSVPYEFQTKALYLLGELTSDNDFLRQQAIDKARFMVASLRAIADGQSSGPLTSDASRPACARLADHLHAHADIARAKGDGR
jgi:hypothetical protein